MYHGFIKVASITPVIKVADPAYNADVIIEHLKHAYGENAKIIVFPELCITGYTCNDLFLQGTLLEAARHALKKIALATVGQDSLVFVGLPLQKEGRLYNVAAVLQDGEVIGFIPKHNLPSYGEFYEGRHFTPGSREVAAIPFGDKMVPFGMNLLFECISVVGMVVGCEICEDLWVANPPSTQHALAGATVIVNLSASDELACKAEYRRQLVSSTSARLLSAYIYSSAGEGESSQDLVFGGHNLIAENGSILAEAGPFGEHEVYSEIDTLRLNLERRRMGTFGAEPEADYTVVPFRIHRTKTVLTRRFPKAPFVPANPEMREKRCEEILSIQAYGLKKRYAHIGAKKAVIGISGGLDSTLALLVTVRCFDMLGLDRSGIIAVTMPCFGTTDRTYENACLLSKTLGADLREIDIKESVMLHFRDIGHDPEVHDVTYENGQARERTQILMNIANQENALVIGTGDMSELALGWATYNGDHMSMYGVNAGVPKSLVRHLVQYYADTCKDEKLFAVLTDVLDTPVSPELLPPVDGVISQKTEDLVGPYELHDFYLYYMLRTAFSPDKIYRIACETFAGSYDRETILKWLKNFYRRFFTQQFKRSCLPDGPKVGSVAVSPRGDLRMPSDASYALWMKELEEISPEGY